MGLDYCNLCLLNMSLNEMSPFLGEGFIRT